MKVVIQRVSLSSVTCGEHYEETAKGLCILVGVEKNDETKDAEYLARKCANMRIFSDDEGKLNLSVKDVGGEILLVSQFTLLADTAKGNRPSFTNAAAFEQGRELYEYMGKLLEKEGIPVKYGVYGGDMSVEIINDGPVTIIMDTRENKKE